MNELRKKTINEINQHCKTNIIWILNKDGKLKLLQCPFKVCYIEDEPTDDKNILWVEEVKIKENLLSYYRIQGLYYPFFCFIII